MLNKSKLFEKYITALGRAVSVIKVDGSEDKILAVVQSFWRGGKARYKKQQSRIGMDLEDFFTYIGPPSYDITSLTEDDIVVFDNKEFCFVNIEPIRIGNEILYYTGTLKRVWRGNNVFAGQVG